MPQKRSTTKKHKNKNNKRVNKQGLSAYAIAIAVVVVTALLYAVWAVGINRPDDATTGAASCVVTSKLVNPCRPWVGSTSGGYSQASANANSQLIFLNKRINDPQVLNSPGKLVSVGKKIDVAHVYHPQGSNLFRSEVKTILNNDDFSQVFVNWKPMPAGYKWKDAGGGNATVNNYIKAGAQTVKALGSRKIFLSVWHEPENDVSSGNCAPNASGASMGSPAQYVSMWRNVRKIFDQQGVTNVVWAMNYMGFQKWDCLVPLLWPGNSYIDWIGYDQYASGTQTYLDSVQRFYNFLSTHSDAAHSYGSKPWALAEHGYGNANGKSTETGAVKYWDQAKAAINANTLPKLKMYLVFDTSLNGNSQVGLQFNKTTVHIAEQEAFNGFVRAVLNRQVSTPGTTTPTTPPSSPAADTTPPKVSLTQPRNGAVVQKGVYIAASVSDNKKVVRVAFYRGHVLIKNDTNGTDGWNASWSTTSVRNGAYMLQAFAYDAAGNSRQARVDVVVKNAAPAAPSKETAKTPVGTNTSTVRSTTGEKVLAVRKDAVVPTDQLITLDASTVTDGKKVETITKAEFYNGDELVYTATAAPFALDSGTLQPGTYRLTQRTYYTDGKTQNTTKTITISSKNVAAVSGGQPSDWAMIATSFVVLSLPAAWITWRLAKRLRRS